MKAPTYLYITTGCGGGELKNAGLESCCSYKTNKQTTNANDSWPVTDWIKTTKIQTQKTKNKNSMKYRKKKKRKKEKLFNNFPTPEKTKIIFLEALNWPPHDGHSAVEWSSAALCRPALAWSSSFTATTTNNFTKWFISQTMRFRVDPMEGDNSDFQ